MPCYSRTLPAPWLFLFWHEAGLKIFVKQRKGTVFPLPVCLCRAMGLNSFQLWNREDDLWGDGMGWAQNLASPDLVRSRRVLLLSLSQGEGHYGPSPEAMAKNTTRTLIPLEFQAKFGLGLDLSYSLPLPLGVPVKFVETPVPPLVIKIQVFTKLLKGRKPEGNTKSTMR